MCTGSEEKDKSAELEKKPANMENENDENVSDELALDSDEEMEDLVDSINSFDPARKK